jgi:hypothetical protein
MNTHNFSRIKALVLAVIAAVLLGVAGCSPSGPVVLKTSPTSVVQKEVGQ